MRKALLVLATLVLLVKAPDFIPYYRDYKVFDFATLTRIFDFQPRREAFAELNWTGREDQEFTAGKHGAPMLPPASDPARV